jgi:hypothetical protein
MISITICNDDSRDLFVTVWDLNQPGSPQTMNTRINQGESKPLEVQEDSGGKGNLNWAAVATDDQTASHSTSSPVTPTVGEQVNVDLWSVQ